MPGRPRRARISSALILFMMKRSRNEAQALLGEKTLRVGFEMRGVLELSG